jgi:hypothetical protein
MKVPSAHPRLRQVRKVLTYSALILLIIIADSFQEARTVVVRGPSQAYAICSNRGYFTAHFATNLSWEKNTQWAMRSGTLSAALLADGLEYDSIWSRLGIVESPNRIPWFEGGQSWESAVVPCRSFYVSYFYLLCAIGVFLFICIEIEKKYKRRECRCAVCGYDLRATPHQCPECGAVVTAARGITRLPEHEPRGFDVLPPSAAAPTNGKDA